VSGLPMNYFQVISNSKFNCEDQPRGELSSTKQKSMATTPAFS
jgi:hypothetical protein